MVTLWPLRPSEVSLSKQYQVYNPLQADNSQRLLIGVPLAITLVFCFGFVAMNPNKPSASISASSKDDTSDSANEAAPSQLPEIPAGVVPAQTLSTEGEASAGASDTTSSSTSNSTSSASTTPGASPAPVAAASSPTSSNPQTSNNSARQTITSKVNVTVTNTTKKLLGR